MHTHTHKPLRNDRLKACLVLPWNTFTLKFNSSCIVSVLGGYPTTLGLVVVIIVCIVFCAIASGRRGRRGTRTKTAQWRYRPLPSCQLGGESGKKRQKCFGYPFICYSFLKLFSQRTDRQAAFLFLFFFSGSPSDNNTTSTDHTNHFVVPSSIKSDEKKT